MLNEFFGEKKELWKKIIFDYGKVCSFVFALLLIVVLFYFIFHVNQNRDLRVVFFDVSQGDSIFIETPSGKQMLIDGGPNNKVMKSLDKEMGFFDKDIDVMIATHGDADHITGLISVLKKYNVAKIIKSPVPSDTEIFYDLEKNIKEENAEVFTGKKGDIILFQDGVSVNILSPENNFSTKDTNEASVSVLITYKDKSFLLTGDLPIKNESKLMTGNLLNKEVTVYKAGHHGSKTSSGEQLLSYTKPYYSVISVGKDNKYGHPNFETLERLKKYSKVVLSTIESGNIEFVTNGNDFRFELGK